MKKILIFFMLVFTSILSYTKTVITGTQAMYTFTSMLTKDTDIKVKSLFETNASMSYDQIQALNNVDKNEYKDVVAVVDLQRVWVRDSLYEFARRENIRTVEIDGSYSYQDNSSLALLINNYNFGTEKDQTNPYVWLDLTNASKMIQIIGHDLAKIFPEDAIKINDNLQKALTQIEKLAQEYNSINTLDGAIVLSEDLNYLVTYLNIYSTYVDISTLNVKNIKKIMKDTDLKVFLTDKALKREIENEIKKNGGTVVVLRTGNLPVEDENDDELMAKDGLIQIYNDNLTKLKNIK
ncbi:metal ABC transporter solute-binding protein, Zn/Mn family [Caviibacter abscessus]|uniref:metal ABC transporter solute-binding protein, Zn/Mn family n=1 Tax=Caviibacter abscessus TaxID=1766719 RepID=UPI00082DF95E|nr:zinc ABC transporter substrate-binding protein [Caviibacter abscessus]